jgi:hypothetical protein
MDDLPVFNDRARDREPDPEEQGQLLYGELVSPTIRDEQLRRTFSCPINFSSAPTRAGMLAQLQAQTPINSYGLPTLYYRADLIDADHLRRLHDAGQIAELNRFLDTAAESLNYTEGFPTQANGMPFWEKLPAETDIEFNWFTKYLALGASGVRHLSRLVREGIDLLAAQEASNLHYWPARAKSYDMFLQVSAQKRDQARILAITDSHYRKAELLAAKVMERFETPEHLESMLEHMTAKQGIEILEKLFGIQRVSVGLSKSGETSTKNPTPANASVESLMQRIAKESEVPQEVSDTSSPLDNIPDDMLGALQELVLLANKGSK